jgi:hypothetical protein
MFQPIQISIPAEKYTEDVYIILQKENTYYASKALKETYTITMPTQEQQKTVTYFGTNGEVVKPFEDLSFIRIEDVTEKIDDINNRLAKAIFLCCYREYKYNTISKHSELVQVLNSVTKENICEKLALIIPEYIISDYIGRLP